MKNNTMSRKPPHIGSKMLTINWIIIALTINPIVIEAIQQITLAPNGISEIIKNTIRIIVSTTEANKEKVLNELKIDSNII